MSFDDHPASFSVFIDRGYEPDKVRHGASTRRWVKKKTSPFQLTFNADFSKSISKDRESPRMAVVILVR